MATRQETENGSAVMRFGPFTVDGQSGELHKGSTRLKVPDQSIAVLQALLERPGELVTREALRARLWAPDTFVDFEAGLNAAYAVCARRSTIRPMRRATSRRCRAADTGSSRQSTEQQSTLPAARRLQRSRTRRRVWCLRCPCVPRSRCDGSGEWVPVWPSSQWS